MLNVISIITKSIFQKDNPAEVDIGEMEEVISKYPYFAAARVLMAGKSLKNKDEENNAIVTAGLFVHNPLRLDWLLKQLHEAGSSMQCEAEEQSTTGGFNQKDTELEGLQKQLPTAKEQGSEETGQLATIVIEPVTAAQSHSPHTGESAQKEFFIEHLAGSEPKEPEPFDQENKLHTSTDQQSDAVQKDHADDQTEPKDAKSFQSGTSRDSHDNNAGNDDNRSDTKELIPAHQENQLLTSSNNNSKETQSQPTEQQVLHPQEKSLEQTHVSQPAEDSPIAFQSYHTIDYFASQGIRLQQAELGNDKLGQQLKSFTEWLRSMKKLPSTESGVPAGAEDNLRHHSVIQSAAHSIESKEILTEAMADVWAKQGNAERAISIYEKLSLQNPGKSDYFAAKIDQLKAL